MRNAHLGFLIIGIAFLAIGIAGQKAFIPIGIVFLVVAALRLRRRHG